MKTHTKLINGYHCEVEIDTDSDPSTQGWISLRTSAPLSETSNQHEII